MPTPLITDAFFGVSMRVHDLRISRATRFRDIPEEVVLSQLSGDTSFEFAPSLQI